MKIISKYIDIFFPKQKHNTAWVPFIFNDEVKPKLRNLISQQRLIHLLLVVVVLLALLAGYYHALFLAENKKYLRLEDRYVRVRDEIGRPAMQDLIDASYE